MARIAHYPLHFVLVLTIFLIMTQSTFAARKIPNEQSDNCYYYNTDGTCLIPTIGQYLPPILGGGSSVSVGFTPSGTPAGSTIRRKYVPGGDDTFVPNPGVEIPIPSSASAKASP